MAWTQSFRPLLNLFLASNCPLCHRPAAHEFCQDCQRQIQQCHFPNAAQFWQAPLPLFPWGNYSGTLKRAIASLKYDNQPQLARPLGHWLAQAWSTSSLETKRLTVVPIPMHIAKQRQRGYNQAELLAKAFCEITGLPLQPNGLERSRATEAQFSLSILAREQNLAGAFQLGKGFCQRRPSGAVLLLDDIYTTGATARAAAIVLHQHQIEVCGLVAVAKPLAGGGL